MMARYKKLGCTENANFRRSRDVVAWRGQRDEHLFLSLSLSRRPQAITIEYHLANFDEKKQLYIIITSR